MKRMKQYFTESEARVDSRTRYEPDLDARRADSLLDPAPPPEEPEALPDNEWSGS
jgi:hypothetical protein